MNILLSGFLLGAIFTLIIADTYREKMKLEILVRDLVAGLFLSGLLLSKIINKPISGSDIASILMFSSIWCFALTLLLAFIASKLVK